MTCKICHIRRRKPFYGTTCFAVCQECIQVLNSAYLTVAEAEMVLEEFLRGRLARWDAVTLAKQTEYEPWKVDAALQRYESPMEFDRYFRGQRDKWLNDLVANEGTRWLSSEQRTALKLLRAHRRRLLRANIEKNITYPADWSLRATKIRDRDGNKCCRCGCTWAIGAIDLHVHHIVHKSNGGSHNLNNLVTLCHVCHNKEHPEQSFQAVARMPETLQPLLEFVADNSCEPLEELKNANAPAALSHIPTVPPQSQDHELNDALSNRTVVLKKHAGVDFQQTKDDEPLEQQQKNRRSFWARNAAWISTIVTILLALFIVNAGGSKSSARDAASDARRPCDDLEFLVQEASKCVGTRGRWEGMTQRQQVFGISKHSRFAGAHTCPGLLEDAYAIGLDARKLQIISDWVNENESNVLTFWKANLGTDFCSYATERSWAALLNKKKQ